MIYANVDEPGRAELVQAMKETNDKKWYRRLKIIELSSQHFCVATLGTMFDLHPQTIRSYIQRYNQGGLEKAEAQLRPRTAPGLGLEQRSMVSFAGSSSQSI